MEKFLKMCIERGLVWQRPDGWWIAGVGEIDSEPVPNKIGKKLDEIKDET